MLPKTKTIISCPTCNKPTSWEPNNATRPFCSDRCKLIDLGTWAGEEHRIPGEDIPLSETDSEGE